MVEIVVRADRLTIYAGDDVAAQIIDPSSAHPHGLRPAFDSGFVSRPTCHSFADQETRLDRQIQLIRHLRTHLKLGDPQFGRPDSAISQNVGDDAFGSVYWHGETDAARAARRAVDHSVDADHLAMRIKERPAGVAGID